MSDENKMVLNQEQMVELICNATLMRQQLLTKMLDEKHDINTECGYPTEITDEDYVKMYARNGIGARIVNVWPDESWKMKPRIYETAEGKDKTPFDLAWEALEEKRHCTSYLTRIDKLSGVGAYGILLLGIDDGKKLNEPIEGVTTEEAEDTGLSHKLVYLRPLSIGHVKIAKVETDTSSPRYGRPTMYEVTFETNLANIQSVSTTQVHWTRVVHIADNREDDEITGVPRMKKDWNRLLDIRKVLGSSAEMYYKGGFPGYSLEADADSELDTAAIKEEIYNYFDGLQRYMATRGLKVKSLQPQVSDPGKSLDSQLEAISISQGIPKRVLMGSEQGELASNEDARRWNGRLAKRQTDYINPFIISPFINRMITIGALPYVEKYVIAWPNLDTQTDTERATVAKTWADALARYVAGDVQYAVPLDDFLDIFGNLERDTIAKLRENLKKSMDDIPEEEEEMIEAEAEEVPEETEE